MLFAALSAVSALNLIFHFLVSRRLQPDDYGALGALLGILLVLSVPATALQVSITKEVAARRRPGELVPVDIRPLLSRAVLWGIGGSLVFAVASPAVTAALRLPSALGALLVAAYIVPTAIGLVPRAVLLGELRYARVSVAILSGAAVRLALGLLLADRGVAGPMAASVLSEICSALVLLPALRPFLSGGEARPVHIRLRDVVTPLVSLTGFWSLSGIDGVVARRLLTPGASGIYVAGATVARAAMFLPSAISTVAFPRFVVSEQSGRRGRRLPFLQAMTAVLVLGSAVTAVLALFPELVVTTLFGERYRAAAPFLGLLAVGSLALGLVNVLLHFHLASGRRIAPTSSWLGVVVVAVGALFVEPSPRGLAGLVIVATGATAAVMVRSVFRSPTTVAPATVGRFLAEASLDLTVVVPYYNPGPLLRANIERILELLDEGPGTFEVIAVSDGSTDDSAASIVALSDDRLRHLSLARNVGKGEALRVGLAEGRGRHLGFIDADGDVDPSVLREFQVLVNLYDPDIVLASKRHPLSVVEYPLLRRVYSSGYHALVRVLFRLNVRDTQTGAKLIRRDVVAAVLPRMVEKRFAFDLELLVVARRAGYNRFLETPVRIRHQFSSTVSWRSVRGMVLDTLAILYRLRVLRWYEAPPGDPAGANGEAVVRAV